MTTRGQKTKERIIQAARHLFHDRGYSNTSIEDICNESGVRRGNLYFYFDSKEELAAAAIDDALEREFPFIEKAIAGETNPLGKIERMLDAMAGYVVAREGTGGCLFGNFALEVGDSHRGLADAISRFFREWHQWLAGLLTEAKNGGMLRSDTDCESLGRLIMSTVEGAILICKASKDKDALLQTIKALKSAIRQYRT